MPVRWALTGARAEHAYATPPPYDWFSWIQLLGQRATAAAVRAGRLHRRRRRRSSRRWHQRQQPEAHPSWLAYNPARDLRSPSPSQRWQGLRAESDLPRPVHLALFEGWVRTRSLRCHRVRRVAGVRCCDLRYTRPGCRRRRGSVCGPHAVQGNVQRRPLHLHHPWRGPAAPTQVSAGAFILVRPPTLGTLDRSLSLAACIA